LLTEGCVGVMNRCWRGAKDVPLGDSGETRKFLRDGDTVAIRGWCEGKGYTVGFGECDGLVLPAAHPLLDTPE
jgi:fumarylacetoacetase